MNKRLFVAAAAAAALLGSYAQINSPSAEGYLCRAVSMYDDGNYFGCIDQLIKIEGTALSADDAMRAHYYRALATVHTDKTAAIELLEAFMAKYPESMQYNYALLALGDCYYGSNYRKALSIYRQVYENALNQSAADDLNYRMAYCYIKLENYKAALPLLEALSGSKAYGNVSKFYRGYLAYVDGKYNDAERLLQSIDTSEPPCNMADFYLSQIYFMRDNYDKSLSMAKNLLKRQGIEPQFVAEANRMAGESAYQLGDDTQAIKYLKEYVSMTEAPLPSSLYILGLNAYNTGQYQQAIEYLTPVTECDNAMGQYAYLYCGQAYLQELDFSGAAMAFDRALNMDYDSDVRETAYYNYAVASAYGGKAPFASTVKIFSDFLRIYPKSDFAPEVQEYIINSYLTDGNYTAALESINEMTSPSKATMKAKQRVLYVLGNKSLANNDYDQAMKYLLEANDLAKYDKATAGEVSLALGEAYYRNGEYKKAVTEIQKYIKANPKGENLPLAYYDLGYALYAQKDYVAAGTQFNKFIQAPGTLPTTIVADGYNRLGDCYYFAKDFAKAEEAYDNAYKCNPTAGDYALFQKALMAGYLRQYSQKIVTLNRLQSEFPASALIPDALLETTESYIQLGKNDKAIEVYNVLVEKYPNTAQGRQGYLQMALVKLNHGDRAGAIADYKTVISRYPSSDEAQQAVDQMKRIAASDGTLNDFIAFLRGVDKAPQLDESEVESLTFENAEKEYLSDGKTDNLELFVSLYRDSNLRARALYYLLESAVEKNNQDMAYRYAVDIVDQYPESSYAQTALIYKAQTEEKRGQGNLAFRTWQKLAETSSSADNLLKARMGVIRTGRDGKHYDEVLAAADGVLASSGVGHNDMAEAIYSRGWVLDNRGKASQARDEWLKIAKETDMLYGIMSAQSLGESYLKAKNYKEAEKWAKEVANADSSHTYWIARGFILLSDVYTAQGDKYKARQYLEAVRDNYTGTERDIFQMIDQRLK